MEKEKELKKQIKILELEMKILKLEKELRELKGVRTFEIMPYYFKNTYPKYFKSTGPDIDDNGYVYLTHSQPSGFTYSINFKECGYKDYKPKDDNPLFHKFGDNPLIIKFK